MGKGQKPNAFVFFMQDIQRNHPGHLKGRPLHELQGPCGSLWQKLSEQERAKYQEMVRHCKASGQQPNFGPGGGYVARPAASRADRRVDCLGRTEEQLAREQEERKRRHEDMLEHIRSMVDCGKGGGDDDGGDDDGGVDQAKLSRVRALSFCTLDVQTWCRGTENERNFCAPSELGMARFSLESGVTATWHRLVRPLARMPAGTLREMMEGEEKRHRIPRDHGDLDDDYKAMVDGMLEFARGGGDVEGGEAGASASAGPKPIVFLQMERRERIELCLEWLSLQAGRGRHFLSEQLLCYDLHELFYWLTRSLEPESYNLICPSNTLADAKLESNVWFYTPGLACRLHAHKDMDVDNHWCALFLAKKYAYVICQTCCELADVEPIVGQHVPDEDPDEEDGDGVLEAAAAACPPGHLDISASTVAEDSGIGCSSGGSCGSKAIPVASMFPAGTSQSEMVQQLLRWRMSPDPAVNMPGGGGGGGMGRGRAGQR